MIKKAKRKGIIMVSLSKKEIQRNRIMRYFIEATVKIIEEEGIDQVTIRKVGDLAGYNSATIYNYFQDLSHLIYFSAMTFLKKFTDDLPNYIVRGKNPLEKYLLIWECFCKYSFEDPQIYNAIFSSNLGGQPDELAKNYYQTFPLDIIEIPEEFLPMVLEGSLSERGRLALAKCIEEGYIKEENAGTVNEMAMLIWQGMLTLLLNKRKSYTSEEAAEITMSHIRQIVLNANHFSF
jgi:AcrR family transcriptional regulator